MSIRPVRKTALLSVFCLFLACVSVLAQSTKGAIVGAVRDEKGAYISGVRVIVTNPANGLELSASTQDNGVFRVAAVPTGTYQLKAEAPGFATAVVRDIEVAVDQTRSLDLILKVAGRAETVTVESNVEYANTETTQLGAVIDNAKVVTLPLNGRNFAQLARLNPGVSASGGGGGQQGGEGGVSGFSSNGQRSSSNNFLVDGIDNNNYFAGEAAQLPSIDSIQEFEVQTNSFSAEYGRNSGAVINLVTRSGNNGLHGSFFEFLRNDIFDARNFFDQPGLKKPELRLNQFGATFGGPLVKNHTFYFLNYEGFRHRAGITRITNVPTLAQRAGTFPDAAGNPVTVAVNAVSAQLFKLFPTPNLSSASGNFISSPNLVNDTDQFLVKLDHRLGESDNLSARYSHAGISNFFPFTPGQSGTTVPGYGLQGDGGNHLFSLSYTHVLNPRMLNEARFGFTRSTVVNTTEAGPRAADFGFNTGHPADAPLNLGNIPQLVFSGGFVSGGSAVSNLGGAIDFPSGTTQNTFQYIDNFSHNTARHAFKYGFDIRQIQLNRLYDLAFSGQVIFDGSQNPEGLFNPLVDFAEGKPVGSLQFVGDSGRSFRTTSYDFFAQDSFKVRPNLTLNYGLRYELNTVIHDATHRVSTFRPQLFQQFLSPTVDQTDAAVLRQSGVVTQADVPGLYDGDHNNFAPRIGIAYSLGRNYKTVVRAAYGIFYETIIGNIPGNIELNPPFLPNFFVPAPLVQFPNSFVTSAGFPVLTVPEQRLRTPYAQHYNLNVQRELPWRMVLELGYVGTTGTLLPRFRQINQAFITQAQIDALTPDVVTRMELLGIPPPAAQFLATRIDLIPPIARNQFFGFAQIFQAEDTQGSNYNSFQAKLDKRTSAGLSFLASYTYSKSIDGASAFFGSGANGTTIFPQDNFNTKAERGLSDFDIRHRLSLSSIYELPSFRKLASALPVAVADGWQIGGILTLQTGQPFSVLTGNDNSRTGLGNDRPDLVGDPNAGPRTTQEWFNTAAFQPNALLTFGSSGRNIVQGPGFHNLDFSILKNTKIGERVNAQFRAEFFNITNHPNFAIPSNVLSAPNFGALTQTPDVAQNNVGLGSGGPRVVQFALKVSF